MVSQCVGSVGPAGMLLADDTEMYERNQLGIESLQPEWLDVRRGLHRERIDDNGFTIGGATDETGMRGFWSHYASLMEAHVTIASRAHGRARRPVPDGYDIRDVEQFLYREARFADESDYDSWEALWTDDALYWVPAGNDSGDPHGADVGDL